MIYVLQFAKRCTIADSLSIFLFDHKSVFLSFIQENISSKLIIDRTILSNPRTDDVVRSNGSDEISATRTAFMEDTLRTNSPTSTGQHIIRLPVSLTSMEKATFVTTWFDNLKTAVKAICEEDEKSL
jgi:hypothetical protein